MTTPDTLTLGAEQLPRVTPCAGRDVIWRVDDVGIYPRIIAYVEWTPVEAQVLKVFANGRWRLSDITDLQTLSNTEPTAALAQRRCVAVLAALLAPLEEK